MSAPYGLLHIYTGDGKGKSTAAVGLACRALGAGAKVCFATFFKDADRFGYHELATLREMGVEVRCYAKVHPMCDPKADPNQIAEACREALKDLRQYMATERCDMLVLDEVLIAVRDGFLRDLELKDFVHERPEGIEMILTGRTAPQAILEMADYVTYMRCDSHPYSRGVMGRKGVEY